MEETYGAFPARTERKAVEGTVAILKGTDRSKDGATFDGTFSGKERQQAKGCIILSDNTHGKLSSFRDFCA